jgi:hypothetical protein
MRKIEREMLDAIKARRNWSKGNTRVKFAQGDTGAAWWCNVYLHGNHIAEFNEMTWRAKVNTETLSRWPTVTTKSRLRALGAHVTTKRGTTYLDGLAVA